MPLQKLSVTGLDNENQRRRLPETINQILTHQFDDSRRQTDAEKVAGVTPVNPAYPFGHVLRYGMVSGTKAQLTAAGYGNVNTPIFNNMMLVAAAAGGMVVHFPLSDWCGDFFVNTSNVIVEGEGGIIESAQTMLRPYTTGGGKVTLQFSDGTRVNERCGIRRIAISGDDGAGNFTDVALYLAGGTVHMSGYDFEVLDGLRSWHIEGSGGNPVTTCFFSMFHVRNQRNVVGARCIYMRRPADPSYVTSIMFAQFHINGPGPAQGYWLEMNGTGGPGIVFHGMQGYVDFKAGCGVLIVAGNESMSIFDVNLDPGTSGVDIAERLDSSKNPGNLWVGHMDSVAGQRVRVAGPDFYGIPPEAGFTFKRAYVGEQYLSGSLHYTTTSDPYDWALGGAGSPGSANNGLPEQDTVSSTGPIRWKRTLGLAQETKDGARWTFGNISEEITLSTSGLTTDSSANLLPADSIIEAVVARTTQAITLTTNFAIGDSTTSARFNSPSASLGLGGTFVGLNHCDQTGAAGPKQTSNAKVRITCTGANPGAGKIRVTVFYRQFIAPIQ